MLSWSCTNLPASAAQARPVSRLQLSTLKWPAPAQTFPTKDYSTFPDAVNALTRLPGFHERSPKSAAFAVAGPVANNRCEMTNLAWVIDGAALSRKYGVR